MKKFFYISLVVGLGLASCSKDRDKGSSDPTRSNATSMQDLKIPANFDWKTTHMVTINVQGAPVDYTQPGQIKVKSASGKLLLTHTARMTEDVTLTFELPKSERTVTVEYGSIVREINVARGAGTFSYVDEPDATANDSEVPQFDEKELEPIILD